MLIFHVITRFVQAGAEENTLEICRAQKADGHTIVIVHGREYSLQAVNAAAKEFEMVVVEELVHQISPVSDFMALLALYRLFRKRRPDAVNTHTSKAGILGRLAARLAACPIIVHSVHILPWAQIRQSKRVLYILAERLCAYITDAFISVSPSVRDECLKLRIGRPEQHFIALSPMPIELFAAATPPDDWRVMLGLPEGAPKPLIILMLARFEPRKRHRAFLEAMVGKDMPPYLILFGGTGPELHRTRILTQTLGLADNVRFLGHRRDPERLIALADICVLTSGREGLPRVLVQYVAGGRAIVATRIESTKDILIDNENGLVVEDVPEAASGVVRLAQDAELRARLAKGAAGTNVDAWSVKDSYRQVTEAYALGGRRSHGHAGKAQ